MLQVDVSLRLDLVKDESIETQSPAQVRALTDHMRQIRPDILIAVDQEGGRVQRLKQDLNDISDVIGDRAFAKNVQDIVPPASAFMKGMQRAACKQLVLQVEQMHVSVLPSTQVVIWAWCAITVNRHVLHWLGSQTYLCQIKHV
ncbi:unnamed protein product [Oppiella nova]|uniref:Uncharacterized protein n=1 Tax=Oppiella nova TaxID=334625 RepID=A0A7R9L771_9ACAR|nr:unnamed protein product [Oppiella nova]CAG2155756.1 unnamed protein product [Oppiella nova]